MSEPIHHEVTIKAAPQRIYQALTDAKQFAEFTGAPADLAKDQGGPFSGFGGQITGRNVELVPNKRVVQAWRAGSWPEGVYSIVRFELAPQDGGTKVTFDQSGFPDSAREQLDGGWHKMYWEPLKKYLG